MGTLDEKDYLSGSGWGPVVKAVVDELREAQRLNKRLDLLSWKRVDEILEAVIGRLTNKEK